MKTKTLSLLSLLFLGLYLLSAASCNKKDDDNASECTGPAQVNISGAVTGNYCLDEVTNFRFEDRINISVVSTEDSGESVMLYASVEGEGVNLGPGTFECGGDNPGFIQLGYHGSNNEFYNSVTGTLTITSVSQSSFKGSFSVTAKGYYDDGQTATITGTINY
ncbi:MAG: hypothetical protein K8F24_01825 [Bacteroidales bacterium]|nr:hypothetical protein [Bacteroidales bacterium]